MTSLKDYERENPDTVDWIKPNGQLSAFVCKFGPDLQGNTVVRAPVTTIPIEEGNSLRRSLPNGIIENYIVLEAQYNRGLKIPYYLLKVRKTVEPRPTLRVY